MQSMFDLKLLAFHQEATTSWSYWAVKCSASVYNGATHSSRIFVDQVDDCQCYEIKLDPQAPQLGGQYHMDHKKQLSLEFLCKSFPQIDVRVIKATVLEHGDDIESAINFLVDSSDQREDARSVDDHRERYFSSENLTGKVEQQQVNQEEESTEKLQLTESPQTSDFLSLIDGRLLSCSEENPTTPAFALSKDMHGEWAIGPERCDEYANPEPSDTGCFKSGSHDNPNMISNNQVSVTFLEGIVQEARNDKESVINLIKEVSNLRAKADQECMAAQKAKSEAARGGEDLLMKSGEMHTQILQMKQDNLRRSGEIYGEKAMLAMEGRELKLRLEQVKQQKEKAIATLHEIQVRLQGCYDTALEERKMAEEDRQRKEEKAEKILAEEEALMATVEQESKKLEVEAESCTQLREFLVDHGSIVDALQGEISILCEDVESFKKQVEEGMWSSVSTASLPSILNPEGPYVFRRCNQLSAASSQGRGQSPEPLYSYRRSNSRLSASSSQEVVESFSEQSTVWSQEVDQKMCHEMNPEEDGQCVHHSIHGSSVSSFPRSLTGDATSTFIPCAHGDMGPIGNLTMPEQSSLDISDELEILKPISRQDAAEEGHQSPNPCNIGYAMERLDYEYAVSSNDWSMEKKIGDFSNLGWRNHAGDDWVFTMEQLEGSSSSSSSVVKVEVTDCCSD